jgi:stress response protein SCP2
VNSAESGPVEIWLRQDNMQVVCSIVNADESTYRRDIGSLSLRGAQREITGYLIGNGYRPGGGWTVEAMGEHGVAAETWRMFNPANDGE